MAKNKKADLIAEKKKNILNNDTLFVISEAYKTARTNLIFSLATSDKKIVIITSANPTEGKSISCINLGISLADMGSSVLIIEADLRKPIIGKMLDINSKNGLSNLLGGFCTLNEAVNENIRNNLDVIVSGPIPPNPAELLASNVMKKLLSVLNDHYDYILIDTPPLNVVTDAQLMNPIVSGIMFVVSEGKTTHPDIAKALRGIELAQGKILGFLKVNCNFKDGGGRGGYKPGYRYNYYSYSYSEPEKDSNRK